MHLDATKKYGFRDKDSEAGSNFENGLNYCAAGIIESTHLNDGKSNPSGKDLSVYFVAPWGEPTTQWRSINEVHIQEISESDYNLIYQGIESCYPKSKILNMQFYMKNTKYKMKNFDIWSVISVLFGIILLLFSFTSYRFGVVQEIWFVSFLALTSGWLIVYPIKCYCNLRKLLKND